MKLVDSLDEQKILEEMLDDAKPSVPPACTHLHYLMFTPFRYSARHATRFRRKGARRGVFYAAETIQDAATETAFYKLLFFVESPDTAPPASPQVMSVFSTKIASDMTLDIPRHVAPEFQDQYRHPTNYAPCHDLADQVRNNGGQIIRFASARSAQGVNLAVLDCAAFQEANPRNIQHWYFHFAKAGIMAKPSFGDGGFEFPFAGFADDPRIGRFLHD